MGTLISKMGFGLLALVMIGGMAVMIPLKSNYHIFVCFEK